MMRKISGYCPACGGPWLSSSADGYIVCTSLDCPRPTAVDELLEDRETEHIVVFGDAVFTIKHPLRERLDDALLKCRLHEWLASRDGPPAKPGTYRARVAASGDSWTFEAIAQ